ncbi:MAG: acyl-CoA dehydrogenase family protein [Oceanococcus sp.]
MNLNFSAEEKAFQQEARAWLQANKPDFPPALTMSRENTMAWEQTLASKGWLAINWPTEYGGPGWSATQRYIWDIECALANVPGVNPFGVTMCAPVLMAFGSQEQKDEHLPHIANATRLWCQGYSEPGSGSDLASLKTRAERDGDDYIVNGQKIWTTSAHIADWIFCLVRTDSSGRKQEGISFLLIDMKTPGIEIRAIPSIDGDHHLNEVFFKDVRVPIKNRVGDEGKGWTIAKFLLGHERISIAGVPYCYAALSKMKELQESDPHLHDDPRVDEDLAALEVDLLALEFTNLRALERAESGKPPGPESSGLKIRGTELQQAMAEYRVEMGAYASLPWQADPIGEDAYSGAVASYNIGRASTIYGGTNEIQKNVLAKFALGL